MTRGTMLYTIQGSLRRRVTVLAGAVAAMLLLVPLLCVAGESCAMMSGVCRDRCSAGESAEQGDFMDCGEKQDCCVATAAPQPALCCVSSAHGLASGSSRCAPAVNGVCASGVASPLACDRLPLCR